MAPRRRAPIRHSEPELRVSSQTPIQGLPFLPWHGRAASLASSEGSLPRQLGAGPAPQPARSSQVESALVAYTKVAEAAQRAEGGEALRPRVLKRRAGPRTLASTDAALACEPPPRS